MKNSFILIAFAFLTFCPLLTSATEEPKDVPPLKIVYFVPSDMEPIPDRQERLGRTMRYVQDFYRKEMEGNGYGPMTFALEWDAPDKLKLYTVNAKKKQAEYGRNDAGAIWDEVHEAMKSQYGIDTRNEVVVIFQLLLKREGSKSIELGPYVGSGSNVSGTAWLFEDERLDSNLLSSNEPGGYYGGPCSLGQFNTHYIGGLAHEMGHAFSLPHVCQLDSQRKEMGTALMGSGNHAFGKELRGQGLGAFLADTSALRLSKIRAFAGDLPGARDKVQWKIEELTAKHEPTKDDPWRFVLSGKVSAKPELAGMIAYNDDKNIRDDYDAKGWVAYPDKNGRFRFTISEVKAVPYVIRLVGVHANGRTSTMKLDYDASGKNLNLTSINDVHLIEELKQAFRKKDVDEIKRLGRENPKRKEFRQKAAYLLKILKQRNLVDVTRLSSKIREADLTWAEFESAETGWGGVQRGIVPEQVFIQVGGKVFESGLFAHAKSRHVVDLDGKWKTLDIGFGLQDGHGGSVRFIIKGDGKDLFVSKDWRENREQRETIGIENIHKLELIVEPVHGMNGTWGIWTNPLIKR